MKGKKLLVFSLTALPLILTSCGNKAHNPADDVVTREDYTSVYETIGSKVDIGMVEEDKAGLAYATVDGKKYELGMDFLSMAMVYNTQVPEGQTKYATETDVYNEWWKLYIQRWNYLMPEVPLYSNVYYDLYNKKLSGFVTTPYWGAADAINKTASTDGKVILGSSTELSGLFRNASWGVSSPVASNNDIQNLTSGYGTVVTGPDGSFNWNVWSADNPSGALAEEPTKTLNADGTLTFDLKLHEGNKFSDGSAVTAKNYLVGVLANSTAVGQAAGGSGNSGMSYAGFKAFKEGAATGAKFSGFTLESDYEFTATVSADYASYYYNITLGGFSPNPLALYGVDDAAWITVDATTKQVGLAENFFAKTGDDYTQAAKIKANMLDTDATKIPYSGPFKVKSWDKTNKVAVLERNDQYLGEKDAWRGKADPTNPINEISYIKLESETQMSKFKKGEVDVIAGITGGTDTNNALKLVTAGEAKETHYDRAGYGKLGFRADFGPTGFANVRRAIAYSINRPQFAQIFTGGYGSVTNGPYYEGFSAFQAKKDEIKLNEYTTSTASAIAELEDGGWVFDKDGNEYVSGIRYKKLEGYEKTLANLTFKSVDGAYQTTYVDGEYYMPLVINWFGSQPNDVTDLLINNWQTLKTATDVIGMHITYTGCDFTTLLAELCLYEPYGWDGVQKLNAANFASNFSSAAYDYAFNWTIDPDLYEDYSACYVMDEADFLNK